MASRKTTQEVGDAFEARVAAAYRRLGYHVIVDSQIAGSQADLLIEQRTAGVGQHRMVVECKYRKGKTGVQIVREFKQSLGLMTQAPDRIVGGIIVASNGFTNTARSAANVTHNIWLVDIDELEDEEQGVLSAYRGFVSAYEARPIFNTYVPLRWQTDDGLNQEAETGLLELIWSNPSHGVLATLFADFGAGKTTLLERVKYKLALRYVAGASKVKPMVVRLGSYSTASSLEALLLSEADRELGPGTNLVRFWDLARRGELAILLDGFDEMGRKNTTEGRQANLRSLCPLFTSGSVCVITCRPAYFPTVTEFNRVIADESRELASRHDASSREVMSRSALPDSGSFHERLGVSDAMQRMHERVHRNVISREATARPRLESVRCFDLCGFDSVQVGERLSRNADTLRTECNCSVSEVVDLLDSVHDLSDLVKRPLLADMIIETLLSMGTSIKTKDLIVGPANLYSFYTNMKLRWDERVDSRGALDSSLRLEFARRLAFEMKSLDTWQIPYNKVLSAASATLRDRAAESSIDDVAADLRTCSFITRQGEDFMFSHRSFYEYFLADWVRTETVTNDLPDLLGSELAHEVLYFLASMANGDEVLRQRALGALQRSGPGTLRDNLMTILIGSGVQLSKTTFDRGVVKHCKLKGLRVDALHLADITLRDMLVSNSQFAECRWIRVRLADTHIRDCRFRRGSIVADFAGRNARLTGCQFREVEVRMSGEPTVTDCTMQGGQTTFSGHSRLDACDLQHLTKLSADAPTTTGCRFRDCKHVTIGRWADAMGLVSNVGLSADNAILDGTQFEGGSCHIKGLASAKGLVLRNQSWRSKGGAITSLDATGCYIELGGATLRGEVTLTQCEVHGGYISESDLSGISGPGSRGLLVVLDREGKEKRVQPAFVADSKIVVLSQVDYHKWTRGDIPECTEKGVRHAMEQLRAKRGS